jgi:hypothetical protein
MTKVRTRKLWLNIRFDIPKTVPRERIVRTLVRSIERGDYKIPREWRVVIEWRNKEEVEMRRGEWTSEMKRSAQSSPGFDTAVTQYLEGKLQ